MRKRLITGLILAMALSSSAGTKELLDASGVKGGLVVVLGCDDPAMGAEIVGSGPYLVQMLDTDAGKVEKARAHLVSKDVYGKVSAARLMGKMLPYQDGIVNLVITSNIERRTSNIEVMRVLAPGGKVVKGDKVVETKKVPEDIDSWTHFLYDASNNAVSKDKKAGPPRGLQWVCGPKYARSHEHFASVSALVSDNGRIFYIEDQGPISSVALPPKWMLVARDAFSGVLLWEKHIENWESQLRGFRSGPPEIGKRLSVDGDRVFVALNYGEPVTVLDAASGKTLEVFESTKGAREISVADGMLFVLCDDLTADDHTERRKWFNRTATLHTYKYPFEPINMYGRQRIHAIDPEGSKELWHKKWDTRGEIMPTTMAISDGRMCFQTTKEVVCLDVQDGAEVWRANRQVPRSRFSWSTPTLVISDGVVLSGDRMPADNIGTNVPATGAQWIMDNHHQTSQQASEIVAFSLKNGSEMWRVPCYENYDVPMDIFVINGVVWGGPDIRGSKHPGYTQGWDIRTGKVVKEVAENRSFYDLKMGHHRCYRNKATVNYLLLGRDGIEVVDLNTGTGRGDWWVRGTCQYGIMPANGFIYAPKHSCACHPQEKLNGFNVLKTEKANDGKAKGGRLVEGEGYKKLRTLNVELRTSKDKEWNTYRGDAERKGYQDLDAPKKVKVDWTAKLSAPVAAPVVTGGRVYVAETDRQAVHALLAEDGSKIWTFIADGRVDSPPTIAGGLCVFGCRDGWVYCLDASDGKLAWKFRAAPDDCLTYAYGQLEALWPVHGSVLVTDRFSDGAPVAYFAAGRSTHLDGGIWIYALELATGKVLEEKRIESQDDPAVDTGELINARALPDIMSVDAENIYMRNMRFDKDLNSLDQNVEHLYAPGGFLDGTWWHRSYWLYGDMMKHGWGGWYQMGNAVPAGRLLAMDGGEDIYGYGRMAYSAGAGHVNPDATESYKLFGEKRDTQAILYSKKPKKKGGKPRKSKKKERKIHWAEEMPFVVKSLVLTKDAVLVAGGTSLTETAEGHGPGYFNVISREDGSKIGECKLPAPSVLDGMAYTKDGIFISTIDGGISCLR